MKSYDLYEDPGHGWLKVRRAELESLGIADQITPYSYARGDYVFLEEDIDLSTFLRAKRATGIQPTFREHHANKASRIRNYASYRPTA